MSSKDSSSIKRPRDDKKKTFQPAWKRAKDLPAFLDASATVSASTFGARRLPEIKALWKANNSTNINAATFSIPTTEPLKSTGGKTSSRHLRRRTTSYKSRKRHRYPAGAPEEIMMQSQEQDKKPTKSRKSRRKNKRNLCQDHENWRMNHNNSVPQSDDKESAESNSDDKTVSKKPPVVVNWMTTHLWYAKRFHMATLWGWQVPMVHTNRGPKAALRLIREGKTLIQDVTWKMAQPICMVVDIDNDTIMIQRALQRLCPNFQWISSLREEAGGSEITTGKGMMHELDQFPRSTIGPGSWLISRQRPLLREGGESANNKTANYYLYFWMEPAIQAQVWAEFVKLKEALLELSKQGQSSPVPSFHYGFQSNPSSQTLSGSNGMCCLQLRGMHATTTLQKLLSKEAGDDTSKENEDSLLSGFSNYRLMSDKSLHTTLQNGTFIPVDFPGDQSSSTRDDNGSSLLHLPWIKGSRALVISHCVCDPNILPQNAPGLGWDIYCDAIIAKELFVTFILDGQACPIGIIEEAYMKMECHPPIADTFPRDFPETEAGRRYWLGDLGLDEDKGGKSSHESQILRLCLEEGESGGRVAVPTIKQRCLQLPSLTQGKSQLRAKISPQRLCSIDWSNLVQAEDNNDSDADVSEDSQCSTQQPIDVVMMRGLFGKPVVDMLSGSGKVSEQTSPADQNKQVSRKRRRVKRSQEMHHVIPLSREEADAHISSCTSLLQSLSLPAVIACHVRVVGAGTLRVGAAIFAKNVDSVSNLLGYMTAGVFSVARGSSHGIGVLGASRLLRAVVEATSSVQHAQNSLAVCHMQEKRQINLAVDIVDGTLTMKATLALLL